MVAQIDEQEIAVVALAVDPAGNADVRADILHPKLAAVMGPIGVHRWSLKSAVTGAKAHGRAPFVKFAR